MKSLFVIAAAFVSLSVLAQKNISINQRINDDGKTMSFRIKGEANGKPIDYKRTFDVSAMSKEEKKALQECVYDSLGLPFPVAPRAPLAKEERDRMIKKYEKEIGLAQPEMI